jgi:uncharacterized protein (DUF1015 family)
LSRSLGEKGRSAASFGFHVQGSDQYYVFTLKENSGEQLMEAFHPALKGLDVLILSRYMFQAAMGFSKADLDDENMFHYDSRMEETLGKVESGMFHMAFLINPTKIDQVKEVARNGLIMPRKSTFFYPKVITGLVFNKIDPNERIQAP